MPRAPLKPYDEKITAPTAAVPIFPLTITTSAEAARLHKACFKRYWDEENIIGLLDTCYGFLWYQEAEKTASGMILLQPAASQADIITLAVLPNARNQGIGTALLQYAFQDAVQKKITELFLEVDKNNTAALQLYKQAGFHSIGTRPNYYITSTGEKADAILLKKNL